VGPISSAMRKSSLAVPALACDELGTKWYRAIGVIFDGWAEAHAEPTAGAHHRILEAMDAVRATGQVTRMPMYFTALAQARCRWKVITETRSSPPARR